MTIRTISVALVASFAGCAAPSTVATVPSPATSSAPTRVLLFIGDGAGTSYWTAARFASDALAVDAFRVVGLVDTHSASSKVTDSAAGATVYATGVRTYNGAIGVGPDSLPRRTVLEIAEEKGMATGLVATSTITHATPAGFAAHVVSRQMEPEIARQYAKQDIDVILGGGRQFFDGSADGASDLLPDLRRRYTYVESAEQLRALRPDTVSSLLGLFAAAGMDRAIDGRKPTLADMTRAALGVVNRDPDGFFLMVEGSQPDWRGHANEPLDAVTAEMIDLDRAIQVGLEYQERHPETLIVVVADHETGGLAIQADDNDQLVAHYTTDYHTAALVPLFARGPGAGRFGGMISNKRVGELLLDAVRGATARAASTSSP